MAAPAISKDIAVPSTPSQEWANKTASSLSPERFESEHDRQEMNQKSTGTFGSTTSTPGYDFPGAYPRGADPDQPFVMDDAKRAALGVYDTAKSYIPGQQDVEKAVVSAGETVKQYLPAAVTSYFPPHGNAESSGAQRAGTNAQNGGYSLPSEESPSESLGATGGVGALPGSKSESGVAKLPEERALGADHIIPAPVNVDTTFLTSRTNADAHTNGKSDTLSNISTQAQDGSEMGSERSAASIPHTPTPTSNSHSASTTPDNLHGNAVVPSSASGDTLHPKEQHVEKSPKPTDESVSKDELKHVQEPILNTTPRTHPLGKEGTKWKGVPLSEAYQTKLDANSERQLNLNTDGDHTSLRPQDPYEASAAEKAKDEAYAMGDRVVGATTGKPSASTRPTDMNTQNDSTKADVGHSPAEKHGRDGSTATNASFPSEVKDETKAKPKNAAPTTNGPTKGSASDSANGTGGSPRKSTFMDKIKGEVKVISGKLAHNEVKVEEGRRLMGKSA